MAGSRLRSERARAGEVSSDDQVDQVEQVEQVEQLLNRLFVRPRTRQRGGGHDGPRSPERTRPLFPQLMALYRRCQPLSGDYAALRPGPEINRLLGSMVDLLRGELAVLRTRDAADAEHNGHSARPLTPHHLALAAERIRQSPALRKQAHTIRHIAALAEAEMERHYSAQLVQVLESESGRSESSRSESGRSESGRSVAGRSVAGRSVAGRSVERPLPQQAPAPRATWNTRHVGDGHYGNAALRRLRGALAGFPYLDSYEQLVRAELRLLAMPVTPRYLRHHEYAHLPAPKANALAQLQAAAAQACLSFPDLCLRLGPRHTFAVCGCGPLPLTGLILHALSGAQIVLIDCDSAAIDQAAALVAALTRQGALKAGAVITMQAEADALQYVHPIDAQPGMAHPEGGALPCHGLLVASLMPEPAKQRLFDRLRNRPTSAPIAVLVRSARGLTAELAYEPARTAELSDLAIPYCGELWPDNQAADHHTLPPALQHGAAQQEAAGGEPLLSAPATVINTCEIYYRLPLPVRGRTLRLHSISSSIEIESAIHLLYQAGEVGSDWRSAPLVEEVVEEARHVETQQRIPSSRRPLAAPTGTCASTPRTPLVPRRKRTMNHSQQQAAQPRKRIRVFCIDPIEASSYPVTETGYALLYRAWLRSQGDGVEIYVVYPDAEVHSGVDESGEPAVQISGHRLLRFHAEPYTHYRSQRRAYHAAADLGSSRCHEEGPAELLPLQHIEAIVFRQETGDITQRRQLLQALALIEHRTVVYQSPRLALDPQLGSKVLPAQLCPRHCPMTFHTDARNNATNAEKATAALRFVQDELGAPETLLVKPLRGDNGQGIAVLGAHPLPNHQAEPINRASLERHLAMHGDLVVQEYLPSVRLPAELSHLPLAELDPDRHDFGEVRFLLIDGTLPRAHDGGALRFARRVPTETSLVADSGISYPTTLSPAERAFLKQLGRHYVRLGIYFGGGDLIRTADPQRPFLFTDAARSVCGHAVVTGALNGEPYLIVDQVLDSLERRIAIQCLPEPTFVPYRGENGACVPFYERVEGSGTAGASSNS